MNQELLTMQRDFLASLRQQDGTKTENALMQKPVSKPGLNAYIHAYSSRLLEALDNDHPVLGQYLGDELWHRMTAGYIEKHPSRFRSLRNFGDLLPMYLSQAEEFGNHPEIAELAQLERRLLDCFDAGDADSIEFSTLLTLQPGQWTSLGMVFHPSLQLLDHDFNSVAIWQNMKDRQAPPALVKNSNSWLLWRDSERITNFRSVHGDEHAAFTHFGDGGNFSGCCEKLANVHTPEAVPNLALGFLKSWCDQGLVIAITSD